MRTLGPIETKYGLATLEIMQYQNGRTAVRVISEFDGSPIATLSVNLPDVTLPSDDYFFAKGWSENQDIIEDCRKSGLFIDTGIRVPTGFVTAEIWRLK